MFARLLRRDSVRPALFLAALTAGTRRSLAAPQRLAFSVQSSAEPSVSAFRCVLRSCPRIRMDRVGRRHLGEMPDPQLTLPASPPPPAPHPVSWAFVLFLQDSTAYTDHRGLLSLSEVTCLHHRDWSSLGLQVEWSRDRPQQRTSWKPWSEPVAHKGAPAGHRGLLAPRGSAGTSPLRQCCPPESVLQEGPTQPSFHPLVLSPAQERRGMGTVCSWIPPSLHHFTHSLVHLYSFLHSTSICLRISLLPWFGFP